MSKAPEYLLSQLTALVALAKQTMPAQAARLDAVDLVIRDIRVQRDQVRLDAVRGDADALIAEIRRLRPDWTNVPTGKSAAFYAGYLHTIRGDAATATDKRPQAEAAPATDERPEIEGAPATREHPAAQWTRPLPSAKPQKADAAPEARERPEAQWTRPLPSSAVPKAHRK